MKGDDGEDAARLQRAEEGVGMVERVGQEKRDPVALADALVGEEADT